MVDNEEIEKYINYLNSTVEKIIFNEQDLNNLKNSIEYFSSKRIGVKEIKQKIVDYLMTIYNNLLKFLPYYLKSATNQNLIERYNSNEVSNDKLKKLEIELSEKNKFLEEVGSVIDRIFNKVEKNAFNI